MDGIININKAAGWTSQDVCARLRSRLHIKKIGHTGTLDPMATGVLPVCIGNATRIIEYYDKDRKAYHASMKLGITTDTLDITGTIVDTGDHSAVSEKAVRDAFRAYKGHISQVPPKYSALKINGKRAYDLARAGADFEIKPRNIEIFSNEITKLDPDGGIIEFDVVCSKGTYIRTICDDIGRALGCGAVMTSLERTASGVFRIEDAIGIEELCAMTDEGIRACLIPMQDTLTELGSIVLNNNRITAFMNGNSSYISQCRVIEGSGFDNVYKVFGGSGHSSAARGADTRFIGIGAVEDGSLKPLKVLNTKNI